MVQHIVCSTTETVNRAINSEGFIKKNENIFTADSIWVGPRNILELNERYKQIIPYIILTYQKKIALYRRTKQGGENRLHNMHSIGFGGHIDAFDVAYNANGEINIMRTIEVSAQREIDEEIIKAEISYKEQVGYILDTSNPVGRVHIGVVEIWELVEPEITSNEEKIDVLGLFSLDELMEFDGEMEGWSSLIIEGL